MRKICNFGGKCKVLPRIAVVVAFFQSHLSKKGQFPLFHGQINTCRPSGGFLPSGGWADQQGQNKVIVHHLIVDTLFWQ
jgi:hypothetical protein